MWNRFLNVFSSNRVSFFGITCLWIGDQTVIGLSGKDYLKINLNSDGAMHQRVAFIDN
jgi:hypothetical protein